MTQEAIREIIRRQREFFYTGATLNIDFRIEATCVNPVLFSARSPIC